MAVLPASQAYQNALIALNTIVQDAYGDIDSGMLLDMVSEDSSKYLFIRVNTTGYGDTPKVCVSYTSSKNNAEILTKNTPEVTDDPVECYSRTSSEFTTRTAWRSNFYLS